MLLAKIMNSVISEAKKSNTRTHTHTHTKINAQCAVLRTKKLANENVYKKAIVVRIDHQSLRSVTIVLENTNEQRTSASVKIDISKARMNISKVKG